MPLEKHFTRIKTLDMHTGGEPLRIVTDGFPQLPNLPILEIRRRLLSDHDHLRKAIMWEPRGHADMYGLVKVDPERDDSAFGVIFIHNEGYSTMCGHATIAIGKAAVDLAWVEKTEPVTQFKIDAPCGQLEVFVHVDNGQVTHVSFLNVPSFFVGTYQMDLPPYGTIEYDLAYGGAFYVYTDIDQFGLTCELKDSAALISLGKNLKQAVSKQNTDIQHPTEADLSFLYGCIFRDQATNQAHHSRNVCIFADGELDRSATGSGVSGRAAILHSKGKLLPGTSIRIESILGSHMDVEIDSVVPFGKFIAVIPKVTGTAHYTGKHEFWIDPDDPLRDGFLIR